MKMKVLKNPLRFFPKIWTISITQGEDFWTDPWTNRDLRQRCIIERVEKKLIVYFHLTKEELEKEFGESELPAHNRIYFHGAYNQVTVCQIKSLGRVRIMADIEKTRFLHLITERLKNKSRQVDKLTFATNRAEAEQIKETLKSGYFFCYQPTQFWYVQYERG